MSITGAFTRALTISLVVVVIVGSTGVTTTQDQSGVSDASRTTPDQQISEFAQIEGFDDVEIHIEIASDRSATWRVRYRYELADEITSEAFERVRQNVSNPPGVFIERMRTAARRAEQETGRPMQIQNGTVSAFESAPHGRFGIVEFRTTWTGFVATGEDGQMVVRDVLDGYQIGENETLVLDWQEQFQVQRVMPAPDESDSSTVRWNGPHEFEVDRPRLVLTTGGESLLGPTVPILLVGVIALISGALVVYRAGTGRLRALVTTNDEAQASESDATPTELLSDEERVLRLLEANGGRMKQQELKDELGWSRTKTSNVVNDLQEADKIEVYRLGRENTLALPGEMDI